MFYRGHIMKLFDIVYEKDNKQEILSCSEINLKEYERWILDKEGKIIDIKERPFPKKASKVLSKNTVEKSNYYYSKYGTEKRRLDAGAIDKKEFDKRKSLLKELRRECKTKQEFKTKYESIYK